MQADVGTVMTVVAGYTDDQGTAETVSSAGTAAVNQVFVQSDVVVDPVEDDPVVTAPAQIGEQPTLVSAAAPVQSEEQIYSGEIHQENYSEYVVDPYEYHDYDRELYQDESGRTGFLKYTVSKIIQAGSATTEDMLQLFDLVRIKISEVDEQPAGMFIKSVGSVTLTLSAGLVTWVMRGGSIMFSMMSSATVLKGFDPMPVIDGRRKHKKGVLPDDNSTDGEVDGLFDGAVKETGRGGTTKAEIEDRL